MIDIIRYEAVVTVACVIAAWRSIAPCPHKHTRGERDKRDICTTHGLDGLFVQIGDSEYDDDDRHQQQQRVGVASSRM